jgi:hypothetical protein
MQVRANLNFDNYKQGVVYWFCEEDETQMGYVGALLGAGYFTEVPDDRDSDGSDGPVPSGSVDVGASPKSEVADGQGEDLQGGKDRESEGTDRTAGSTND